MFISSGPPPIFPTPMLLGAGDLCRPLNGMRGTRGIGDPFGLDAILGGVTSILAIQQQKKIAEDQIKAEARAAKMAAMAQARGDAESLAQQKVAPANAARQSQMIALYAIGGVAALLSLSFILGATKKGKR